ncbi:MAG TPA: hypothetical protein VLE70_04530 [Anaerolineae bacterium]|jgi:hypothetical protein|nr:hypothetical protein [Anaerolineae bacterium]
MTITLIVIGVLITLSTLSSILILTTLALSSQGSYWGEEVGQELIPARESETIGER